MTWKPGAFLVIDFETFYDTKAGYSLRKMTTHEYVTDPRFEVLSVAVKPVGQDGVAVRGDQAEDLLRSLPIDQCAVVGHNLQFDGYILKHHFSIKPALYMDTMFMAMALLGGRVKSFSLGAVYEALVGRAGKQKGGVLTTTNGKHFEDLSEEEAQQLLAYNYDDVVETEAVFLKLIAEFPQTWEIMLLDWAVRTACNPLLRLDAELLKQELSDVRRKRRQLIQEAGVDRATLMSNAKFAEYLRSLGVEPPTKESPTTGKETWAFAKTDDALQDLRNHSNPAVAKAVEARLVVKSTIAETRAAKLLRLAETGLPVPVPLKYAGAVNTGRFSGGGGLNFQNIPKKGEHWDAKAKEWKKGTSRLRLAVKPPEGWKIIVADSSNIELRVCHYIAGEPAVLSAVREGRDAYCEFASVIYGREVNPKAYEEGSDEHADHVRMRTLGKVAMLALQYGMGAGKYIDTVKNWTGIELSEEEAQRTVQLFRATYPRIKLMWHKLDDYMRMAAQAAPAQDPRLYFSDLPVEYYIKPDGIGQEVRGRLPGGLELKYPDLRISETGELTYYRPYNASSDRPHVKLYGGLIVENCTQALAAGIIRNQMANIMTRLEAEASLPREALVFQVHDEVVCVAPEDRAEQVFGIMQEEMRRSPDWAPGLPLDCEGSIADSYGEAK